MKWIATGWRRLGWVVFFRMKSGTICAETEKFGVRKSTRAEMRETLKLCVKVIR